MQYIVKKKVLCSAEKGSVIWAEPNSRSSAEQFCRTKRSVGIYVCYYKLVQTRPNLRFCFKKRAQRRTLSKRLWKQGKFRWKMCQTAMFYIHTNPIPETIVTFFALGMLKLLTVIPCTKGPNPLLQIESWIRFIL